MFGFLKEKLSKVVKKISDRVEKEEPVKEIKQEEKKLEEIKPEKKEVKKGIIKKAFEKVTKKVVEKEISDKDLEDIFDDLGINLLEADVAFEVSEKIKEDLKKNLVGKQWQVSQGDDVIPLGALAFGQDCRLADNFGPGLFHNHLHTLQGRAGADHVIHEDCFFIVDQFLVFFVHDQGLRLAGGDGQGLGDERRAHVGFVGFAQNDVGFFRLHGEGVCQRDGLGFRGDQDVEVHGFERLRQCFRRSPDKLGIAEDVQDGNPQAGLDLEQPQVALDAGDFDGVGFMIGHGSISGLKWSE